MRQILYGMQILKYLLSGLTGYLYLYVCRYLYLSIYVDIRHFIENVCQSLLWENELFLIYYLLLIQNLDSIWVYDNMGKLPMNFVCWRSNGFMSGRKEYGYRTLISFTYSFVITF